VRLARCDLLVKRSQKPGGGGSVRLDAPLIELLNGGVVAATATGTGDGDGNGNGKTISVRSGNEIQLSGGAPGSLGITDDAPLPADPKGYLPLPIPANARDAADMRAPYASRDIVRNGPPGRCVSY
jgi:hypothetical protein